MVTPSFHLELVREHIKHACPVAFNLQQWEIRSRSRVCAGNKKSVRQCDCTHRAGGPVFRRPLIHCTPFTPHSPWNKSHHACYWSLLSQPSFCLTWSICLFSCLLLHFHVSAQQLERDFPYCALWVCLLIFGSVYTHMHVRGLRSVSGAIHSLGPHLPWLLRLAWHPLSRLGWLTQTPQEFICLCLLPQRGITSVCLFHLGSGAWPQGLMLEWQALCRLTHLLSFQKTLESNLIPSLPCSLALMISIWLSYLLN